MLYLKATPALGPTRGGAHTALQADLQLQRPGEVAAAQRIASGAKGVPARDLEVDRLEVFKWVQFSYI